jgi:hypothetical protein
MLLIVPESVSRFPGKHLKSGSDQSKRLPRLYLSQMTVVEGQRP